MKKTLILAICVFSLVINLFGQNMQASIGTGSTSTRVKIYIRPTASLSLGNISTFQFNLAIPTTVVPAPTLSFVGVPVFGGGWVITPSYIEDGMRHYEIVSGIAGPLTLGANVELELMELEFTGGPGSFTSTGVALYTLPGGGTTGNALFLCTGAANSVEGQLYYNRGGVVVVNENSYTGVLPSSATLSGVLPVVFSNYNVKCSDKGAMVYWTTASESNSDKFEIQKSINGVDWETIGDVAASGSSIYVRNYEYLDLKGGAAYYRIRQVDLDGIFTYTAVKQTNCSAGQFDVVLYPIPAKDNLTVVIKSDKITRTELQIMDMSGRTIRRIPAQINSGNNTINLDVSRIPAGQYMLVSSAPEIEISKKFTVIR